jgi:hypothetical protein
MKTQLSANLASEPLNGASGWGPQGLRQFRPRQIEQRNPLASPMLMTAIELLHPCPAARQIETLIRAGRILDAAALAEQITIDADRP